jgi:hypothetical protein
MKADQDDTSGPVSQTAWSSRHGRLAGRAASVRDPPLRRSAWARLLFRRATT